MHLKAAETFATAIVIGILAAATVANAQTISRREAREHVASAERAAEAIYQQFPRLREIDEAVRQDCAEKNAGKAADSAFCRCGSAVTMGLWRSGVDPQMVPRLQSFLSNPEAVASDFIRYQGPELYAPMCRLAAT